MKRTKRPGVSRGIPPKGFTRGCAKNTKISLTDFGEADLYEDGTLFHGYHLNLSFPYSDAGYVQLFKGENPECLLGGLKDIFEHIGGVPQRTWFYNATAIVKFTKKGEGR